MKDSSEYYKEEDNRALERLELQQKKLHDRHNSEELQVDKFDYMNIVNANNRLCPKGGEKLSNYIEKLKVHQEISHQVNWDTHVDNPYKVWHTHRIPAGCFMCKDQEFIGVLIQALEVINHLHPNITF